MTIRKLDKKEWCPFLDGVSSVLQGERAEIEVLSLKLGDQVAAVARSQRCALAVIS